MRAFVTGCAGFIGSHLADYLLGQGHDVVGIDSLVRGSLANVNPRVDFSKTDIRDPGTAQLLAGAHWVFHLAAVATTPWAVKDPVETNSINVGGTVAMLEAARRAGVKRFINASSNVVYAKFTPYWVSKEAAENYTTVYANLYGLPALSLRFSNVFGSLRQNGENCIMSMRASALANGYVWVSGDGRQSRDFTNVADICRALVLAAESGHCGGTIDVCTGVSHSMNEVAAMFGVPVKHTEDRAGDVKHIVQDPQPAQVLLGFTAQVPFSEGMAVYL